MIHVRRENECQVIQLRLSALTGSESAELNRVLYELIQNGENHIVVDLASVEYINSLGLGLLASIHSTVTNVKGNVSFVNLSERVFSLIKITKLDNVISCKRSLEDTSKE